MTNHQPYTACAVCGRRIERHFERWVHRLPRPIGNDLTDFGKALGTFSLATAAHEALPRAECGSSCRPDMHHYDKNGGLAGIGLHTIACDTNNDRDFFDRGGANVSIPIEPGDGILAGARKYALAGAARAARQADESEQERSWHKGREATFREMAALLSVAEAMR